MTAKRVLAVENNELVLSFLEAGLTTAGYDVDTATNGRDALAMIEQRPYDAIVTDVYMPEMDGLGLCRALGERQSAALGRLVLLTNADCIDDHRTFLEAAGVWTLAKPVELEQLRAVVQRVANLPRHPKPSS